jgi:hypothetical protein
VKCVNDSLVAGVFERSSPVDDADAFQDEITAMLAIKWQHLTSSVV